MPNPKGTAVPEMVCANLHGDVCRKQVFAIDSVNAFVKNTYDVLKSNGIRRADLPIVCKLGAGLSIFAMNMFLNFIIADMHGAGDNIICLGLAGGEVLQLAEAESCSVAITTMHRLVHKALRYVGAVGSLLLSCFDFVDAEVGDGFAIKLAGVRFS